MDGIVTQAFDLFSKARQNPKSRLVDRHLWPPRPVRNVTDIFVMHPRSLKRMPVLFGEFRPDAGHRRITYRRIELINLFRLNHSLKTVVNTHIENRISSRLLVLPGNLSPGQCA